MGSRGRARGFTIIEMLTVVAIIMLVMALALPNFVEMMRGRKWSAALGNVQLMITRARSFAANARTDAAVEFYVTLDNNTHAMWIESEVNLIETMPDYSAYCANLEAGNTSHPASYAFSRTTWYYSGGHTDGTYHPDETQAAYNGDNARQSGILAIGNGMTIDLSRSPDFISYDAPRNACPYGKDNYPDIRVGQHGALVPSIEPTICLREINQDRRMTYQVVRCTGRLVKTR